MRRWPPKMKKWKRLPDPPVCQCGDGGCCCGKPKMGGCQSDEGGCACERVDVRFEFPNADEAVRRQHAEDREQDGECPCGPDGCDYMEPSYEC